MSCRTCEHCDTNEATRKSVRGSVIGHVLVGICTNPFNYFHGKHVVDWMTGCDDYIPVASAQGDGDPGSEAA
jgi:hypothetical protein